MYTRSCEYKQGLGTKRSKEVTKMSVMDTRVARRGDIRTATRYTQREDNIVLKCVSQSPGNLAAAFDVAATKLPGRNAASISARYYGKLKDSEEASFTMVSKHGAAPGNVKIMRRQNDDDINLNGVALSVILPMLSKREKAALLTKLLEEQ